MNQFLPQSELAERATAWIERLALDADAPLQLKRPALCVLDMQYDFLRADGGLPVWGGPAIVAGLARLIDAFRAAKRPVFFSRHVCLDPAHSAELGVGSRIATIEGLLREGSTGAEIVEQLRPLPGEYVITKYKYSAFFGSPLEPLLRAHAVENLVITGVLTNVCCETTAHDAFFRDFGVVFVLDGTGAFDEDSHLATLATIKQSYGSVVTAAQVCNVLREWRMES